MKNQNVNAAGFSERFRTEVIKKGVRCSDVARALKVSRQTVLLWSKGLSIPQTSRMIQLAHLFGVTPEYLMFGAEADTHKEPKKDGMFGNLEETILDMYEILQEIRNELMLRKDDGK